MSTLLPAFDAKLAVDEEPGVDPHALAEREAAQAMLALLKVRESTVNMMSVACLWCALLCRIAVQSVTPHTHAHLHAPVSAVPTHSLANSHTHPITPLCLLPLSRMSSSHSPTCRTCVLTRSHLNTNSRAGLSSFLRRGLRLPTSLMSLSSGSHTSRVSLQQSSASRARLNFFLQKSDVTC